VLPTLRLVQRGCPLGMIAAQRQRTVGEVLQHLNVALSLLGVTTVGEVMSEATRRGLLR
jgi:DNA-binding NarL/FixJ family response regulator